MAEGLVIVVMVIITGELPLGMTSSGRQQRMHARTQHSLR